MELGVKKILPDVKVPLNVSLSWQRTHRGFGIQPFKQKTLRKREHGQNTPKFIAFDNCDKGYEYPKNRYTTELPSITRPAKLAVNDGYSFTNHGVLIRAWESTLGVRNRQIALSRTYKYCWKGNSRDNLSRYLETMRVQLSVSRCMHVNLCCDQ